MSKAEAFVFVLIFTSTAACGADRGAAAKPSCERPSNPATTSGTSGTGDALTLTPSVVKPGQRFTATFPTVGDHSSILTMKPVVEGCSATFALSFDGTEPVWTKLGRGDAMVAGADVHGQGVPAVVPSGATPTDYRICADGTVTCGVLTVVR